MFDDVLAKLRTWEQLCYFEKRLRLVSRHAQVMLHTINCKASNFSLLVDDGNSITVGLNSKWGDKYARDATFKISYCTISINSA